MLLISSAILFEITLPRLFTEPLSAEGTYLSEYTFEWFFERLSFKLFALLFD